ncbi:MAG: flagellar motor stator protein MotA [Nitrospinae bacterium]|nr:flagellar motor stator protein MotA [Nitrospinota bacterium]
MFVIIGIAVVLGSVIGGFLLEGGPIMALMQWVEFLIIGGTALGALLIGNPPANLKKIVASLFKTMSGVKINERTYIDLLRLFFELTSVYKKDGVLALESHIENPRNSAIFKKYPSFLSNAHAVELLCDSLRIVVLGGVPPHELETMIEGSLETHHEETARIPSALSKIGDSLPGIGIVAAVLGIVITMQAIGGPPEEIGHKVGAALVGTFLGILLCYGFISPLTSNIEILSDHEARYLHCIKAGVVAIAKNFSPMVVVEIARKQIYSDDRPSFGKLDKILRART